MPLFDDQAKKEVSAFFSERLKANGAARIITFVPKDVSGCEYCSEIEELSSELETLSQGKVKSQRLTIEDARELADRFKVKRAPATVVTDDKQSFALKFYGLPSGYEFSALLADLEDVSNGRSSLRDSTIQSVQKLDKPVHIQVFVTPSCPYCPRAVRTAHQLSLANPAMIDAEMIESSEFPELAERYSVMAVPKIVINDSVEFDGALPEQTFVSKVEEAVSVA
ncbi:MAG: thioredoxin family protein [Nitrososphaerota archaeon]|nr:thioredoxin family protein [Nitrososphaerota archaeon]